MICRIDASISSMDGSCAVLGFAILYPPPEALADSPPRIGEIRRVYGF
jgi:hypothetical protein